jgi:hypothetical protein
MKLTCTTKQKGQFMQVEHKWCDALSKNKLKLYRLCNFWEKVHSPFYMTLYNLPRGLHLNNIFSQAFKVGVPKLFWNFNHLYLSQIKPIWKHTKTIYYKLQKYLSNNVWHALIKAHLTLTLKGFVVKNQISTLLDYNSCILGLNEQCGLSQFDSQPFFLSQLMHFKFKQTNVKTL